MAVDPIRSILAAQEPGGWWAKPGPGYGPKYRGTVWQVIFLDQLGADPDHPQINRACDYALRWCPTATGGFGCSAAKAERPPPPSAVIHCLNGNLLRALIGFGRLDDERVQATIGWAARAITGQGVDRWYASGTSGPGFACAANQHQPCAWGALKELGALARVPARRRTPLVRQALDQGAAFLFSQDPAVADYPMGWGNTKPSTSWVQARLPIGLHRRRAPDPGGAGRTRPRPRDPRLTHALAWLESGQNSQGRWRNRSAYNHKTWIDIERHGQPSKWVTLRACSVLRAAYG
jgi:hypothetical protein